MRRSSGPIGHNKRLAAGMMTALALAAAGPASASEGGASFYLLGAGGPGAGESPPLPGLFFDNSVYVYDGSASGGKQFVVGGNVVAGLKATIAADFPTLLWVPTTNFLGGTLSLGAIVPVGAPIVDVKAVLTGPRGRQITITRHDSALIPGDPVALATLGWKTGKLSIQPSVSVSIPIGTYREGQLANLAFHRWIVDTSLAATWADAASGWDVSGKAGITFNGNNDFTDYNTGNEFHGEASLEKTFEKKFSAGVQGYYFRQISGDSGAGATLGAFKGEVAGVGLTAAAHVTLGRSPSTIRFRIFQEFDVTNRMKGNSYFLSLTLPFHLVMPKAAGK